MNRRDKFRPRCDSNWWIEPAIHIILAVSAVLAIGGIITVIHFVRKFW